MQHKNPITIPLQIPTHIHAFSRGNHDLEQAHQAKQQ
jgi:hypothetical protein